MLAILFEEPTDELNDLEPIDRQPPADMVQLLGSLFAGALGLEADEPLEPEEPAFVDAEHPEDDL